MDSGEILRRLMPRLRTADIWHADRSMLVVLGALGDAVSPKEASDLASQLPDAYHDLLAERAERAAPPQLADRAAFLDRVQRELGLASRDEAERVAASVMAVLKEAVTPGEIEEVASELEPGLRAMLEQA
jgi:uncharacterized protein (DUF2267 family)